MKNIKIKTFLSLIAFLMIIFSCKEKEDLYEEVRLFRPVTFERTITGTTVGFTWLGIKDAVSYTFELSQDSLEFTNIIYSVTDLTDNFIVISELAGSTRYSARVKANAVDPEFDSKFNELTFNTPSENIFFPLTGDDVTENSVNLTWQPGMNVTAILIESSDSLTILNFDINENEKASGQKLCEGLEESTEYIARIFNGTIQRGKREFTTLEGLPEGSVKVTPDMDFVAAVNTAESGSVIYFSPGTYSSANSMVIGNKSLTIKAINPIDRPVLYVKNIELSGSIGNVIIENMEFSGFIVENGIPSANKQSYFIDFTAGFTSIDSLIIKGCTLRNFARSLLLMTRSPGGTVSYINIENCIINDATSGNQEVIDARTSTIDEIILTSSTVYNCNSARMFMRLELGNPSVLVDHCTFYNICAATGINFIRNRGVTGITVVKNSIMAQMDSCIYNLVVGSTINIAYNNYFNTKGLANYTPQSVFFLLDPAFIDPNNGDFTLPFGSPLATADESGAALGDPRWAPN